MTQGAEDWDQFVQQRLRWATKNGNSTDHMLKMELGIVYLLACFIVLIPFLFYFNWSFYASLFVVLLSSKLIGDLLLLRKASSFFGKGKLMRNFFSSFWIHIFYIAGIGTLSLFKKEYVWKGRNVK